MIRPMEQRDRQAYMELAREFYSTPAVICALPEGALEESFARIVQNDPFIHGYMIEMQGEVAGYGTLAFTFSTECGGLVAWLEELYILPRFQGHGLGGEFFDCIHKRYDGKVRRYRLEVAPDNEGAIRLYTRLGYEKLKYLQMVRELQK